MSLVWAVQNHQNDVFRNFSFGLRLFEDHQLGDVVDQFMAKVRAAPEPIAVISDESLRTSEGDSLIIGRLAKIFPGAHILVTVRNQFTAIPSHYASHGRFLKRTPVSRRVKYVRFREYMDFNLDNHYRGFFRHIKYHQFAQSFADKFGHHKIVILPFEELLKKPSAYFARLADLFEMSSEELVELWNAGEIKNPADSARLHAYLGLRSRLPIESLRKMLFLPGSVSRMVQRYLERGSKPKFELSSEDMEKISTIYGPDNKKLQEDFGVSLGTWQYPMTKDRHMS